MSKVHNNILHFIGYTIFLISNGFGAIFRHHHFCRRNKFKENIVKYFSNVDILKQYFFCRIFRQARAFGVFIFKKKMICIHYI